MFLLFIVGAFPSSWALKCYQCEKQKPKDTCIPDIKLTECPNPTEKYKYCNIFKRYDETNQVVHLTHKCSVGSGKEGCEDVDKSKICNNYCDTDGCNVPENKRSSPETKSDSPKDTKSGQQASTYTGNVDLLIILLASSTALYVK